MPFIKFSVIGLSFIIGCGALTFASEGGGEAEGKEAEEGASTQSASPGSGADREWAKRKSKLNVYETQIKELTKKIQHLIQMKNAKSVPLDEKGKPIDVLETIVVTHKKLKEAVDDYNKEEAEMKYRFPEEGTLVERRYVPMRMQTLDQIEREIGLNGELTRIKKKIDSKYAAIVGDETAKPIPQKPVAPESTLKEIKPKEADSERLKLSR